MESFSYIIRSIDKNDVTERLHDCHITLNGLDPSVELFYCKVASLITYTGYQYNANTINKTLYLCVDSNFFYSPSYITKGIEGMKMIASGTTNIDCNFTHRGLKCIIPNFNGKTFRFKEFIDGAEPPNTRAIYSRDQGFWVLTLYLTPIKKTLIQRPFKHNNIPFSVYISSAQKLNASDTIENLWLRMPYINIHYKKFYVEVKELTINSESIDSVPQVASVISLWAYDLADNGFQSDHRKCINMISMSYFDNINIFHSDQGSKFVCDNFSNKLINFQIRSVRDDFLTVSHPSIVINSGGETTNWILHMLIYPIE